MRLFLRFRYTACALTFAAIHALSYQFADIDLFERLATFLARFERWELDEVVLAGVVCLAGATLDLARGRAEMRARLDIEKERVRVLKLTMSTVNDVVGNSLNGLQLFRMEAEDRGALPEGVLAEFDSALESMVESLATISSLRVVRERRLSSNVVVLDVDAAA